MIVQSQPRQPRLQVFAANPIDRDSSLVLIRTSATAAARRDVIIGHGGCFIFNRTHTEQIIEPVRRAWSAGFSPDCGGKRYQTAIRYYETGSGLVDRLDCRYIRNRLSSIRPRTRRRRE